MELNETMDRLKEIYSEIESLESRLGEIGRKMKPDGVNITRPEFIGSWNSTIKELVALDEARIVLLNDMYETMGGERPL